MIVAETIPSTALNSPGPRDRTYPRCYTFIIVAEAHVDQCGIAVDRHQQIGLGQQATQDVHDAGGPIDANPQA